MTSTEAAAKPLLIEEIISTVLSTIEREREREIIARRYGLYDRKETLEQIGEVLSITRERVRQLEKAVMARLKAMAEKDLPHIKEVEAEFIKLITELGHITRISELSSKVTPSNTKIDQSRVSFLAQLCPNLTVIDDNDHFFHAVGIAEKHTEEAIKKTVASIIETIKKANQPVDVHAIKEAITHLEPTHIDALARISKSLATLNGQWGLVRWPLVNPKNIRDKIYVILKEGGKPLHFSQIAGAIKDSSFKRKDVTTQAIHNELIKDKRFVLIGRGIYALSEWGFSKGTVSDIITEVLKDSGTPLHRDEIVKRVLKHRQVKETTILLNLQGKKEFKRTSKATYDLAAK
jgi:Sigma-70, region 4